MDFVCRMSMVEVLYIKQPVCKLPVYLHTQDLLIYSSHALCQHIIICRGILLYGHP